MKPKIKYYTVKELLKSSNKYIIPRYQRNYAWGNKEICQLIQDVADNVKQNPTYYIGTLVVHENQSTGCLEIIDGQQRFTTLTIIMCFLKKDDGSQNKVDTSWYTSMNLHFQSRDISSRTLEHLFQGHGTDYEELNTDIISAYNDVKNNLKKIITESALTVEQFCDYFFNKVEILSVQVPEDTDLNHYFEIMNTRGVQLEKHEILKASFLEVLDDGERYIASKIWESCANMERYVQYGFSTIERNMLFGNDWNTLNAKDVIFSIGKEKKILNHTEENKTIEDLITSIDIPSIQEEDNDEGGEQRFNTIINFPNFLLQVLRVQTGEDVPLDDKRLLESFAKYGKKSNTKYDSEFVKAFLYNLLKAKYLFDRYVLKREFYGGSDHWSLKELVLSNDGQNKGYYKDTFEDKNREILMLLSMFHVSTPTLVYKHWLNAVLKWLFENGDCAINSDEYKQYLLALAKNFVRDRYLAKEPVEFYNLIYKNEHTTSALDYSLLDRGTDVENFVFNYLDYLLWEDYNKEKKYFSIDGSTINDKRIENFEYTFRSSVEHYYPQHPIEGIPEIESEWLNSFGNLCLISSSKNSRLSNNTPAAKKDYYKASPMIDSIKQWIMMQYSNWDTCGENGVNEIKEHGEKMKELLRFVLEH